MGNASAVVSGNTANGRPGQGNISVCIDREEKYVLHRTCVFAGNAADFTVSFAAYGGIQHARAADCSGVVSDCSANSVGCVGCSGNGSRGYRAAADNRTALVVAGNAAKAAGRARNG